MRGVNSDDGKGFLVGFDSEFEFGCDVVGLVDIVFADVHDVKNSATSALDVEFVSEMVEMHSVQRRKRLERFRSRENFFNDLGSAALKDIKSVDQAVFREGIVKIRFSGMDEHMTDALG